MPVSNIRPEQAADSRTAIAVAAVGRGGGVRPADPARRQQRRLASAGRAQTAVEVRVADAEDGTLPPGEPGEVLVRGDTVIPGYWDDPDATAAALRGGWLHTGDVGVFDQDGYLTLKDRSKDLIISGGANIYPREVEEALQAHAGVRECAVVGRPHADWGEEVVAFVVARPDAEITAETLDAHCLERIARFKRPKTYRFVEALPKNNKVAEEEGYKKKEVWIAKSDYMPRKQLYYDLDGNLFKELTVKNVKPVKGAKNKYRMMHMEMVNTQTKRRSVFQTKKVEHSPNADDSYFTTSYIERP